MLLVGGCGYKFSLVQFNKKQTKIYISGLQNTNKIHSNIHIIQLKLFYLVVSNIWVVSKVINKNSQNNIKLEQNQNKAHIFSTFVGGCLGACFETTIFVGLLILSHHVPVLWR